MLSFELLLVMGVVGFYLFDSAMLLYTNELIFSEINGKWFFSSPEAHAQILKKYLYLPNPLTPDKPIFRVFWSVSEPNERQQDKETLQNFLLTLKPSRHMTYCLFLLLFIVLPVVVFVFGSGLELLLLIVAIYLTISAMLIQVYRQRKMLELTGKTIVKLAFDSLMCAPFALNLLRKITLHRSLTGDPIDFAHQTFDAATFARLVQVLCHQVDKRIQFEDEESSQYSAFKEYRNRITSMVS
jgi:hypothetical protein